MVRDAVAQRRSLCFGHHGIDRRRVIAVAKKDATVGGKFPWRISAPTTSRISRRRSSAAAVVSGSCRRRPPRPSAGRRRRTQVAGDRRHAGRSLLAYRSPVLGDGRGANRRCGSGTPRPRHEDHVEHVGRAAHRDGATARHRSRRHPRGEDGERDDSRSSVPIYGNSQGRDRHSDRARASRDGFDAQVRTEEPRSVASPVGLRALRASARTSAICSRWTPTRRARSFSLQRRPPSRRRATKSHCRARKARRGSTGAASRARSTRPTSTSRRPERLKRFPETRATSSCPGCGRQSRRTRRAISARRRRPITARTRASTIRTTRSA